MNPIGKKFTSMFLILSLMTLSVNLYAKERRGAELIITKKDRQKIQGELITVKPTSLLLVNTEGRDVSVEIEDIRIIRIVKKLGVARGALVGFLWGAGFAASFIGVIGITVKASAGETLSAIVEHGWPIAVFGATVWAILGALINFRIKIKIEGKSDSEIQKTLDKLRRQARIRNYK